MLEVLDMEPETITASDAMRLPVGKAQRIEFRRVSFTHPHADQPVLDDFSLIIEPGEKVAFVGEDGASKTTIIKLLCRF